MKKNLSAYSYIIFYYNTSVLDQLLFFLCTSQLFSFLENNLNGYADGVNLLVVVQSPSDTATIAEWWTVISTWIVIGVKIIIEG